MVLKRRSTGCQANIGYSTRVGERKRPETRLEISQEAAGMGTLGEVETDIEPLHSRVSLQPHRI